MTTGLIPRINRKFSASDALIALKALFKKRSEFQNESNRFHLNHARTGIRLALSSLNLKPGSKVGVVCLNCRSVMHSVHQANLQIEFIDLTDNFTIDLDDLAKKKENLSALIVTHLFGIPNNVSTIRNLCPGIPIIEDCAHAYLSQINGKKAGNEGDYSVFSYGPGKFPSLTGGGVLQVNSPDYLFKIVELYNSLPYKSIITELKAIGLNILANFLYKPFLCKHFTRPVQKLTVKSKEKQSFSWSESKFLKSGFSLFTYYRNNMDSLLERQVQNTTIISKYLTDCSENTYIPAYPQNIKANYFMFPVLADNPEDVSAGLLKRGIESGPHFSKAIAWAQMYGYIKGNCPNSERILKSLVVIPCHYNIPGRKLKKLLES